MSSLELCLTDQQHEFTQNPFRLRGISRSLAQVSSPSGWIQVVMGARRSGKSTFCQQQCDPARTVYINFDDDRLYGLKAKDLQEVYETALKLNPALDTLILDEIQNTKGWELFVNRLHRKGLQLWVTGSNSNLLSRELATHLTGRAYPIEMFPFSWTEWLTAKGHSHDTALTTEKKIERLTLFEMFLKSGGFPELTHQPQNAGPYLRTLFDQILSKDIAQRHPRTHSALIKQIALHAQQHYATRLSYRQVERAIEASSINNVKQALFWLEEAYLVFQAPNRTKKLKLTPKIPRKTYSIDTGMIESLRTKLTPDRGLILENFVYLELRKKGLNVASYLDEKHEVDFVILENNEATQLVQVCFGLEDKQTEEREVAALLHASSLFRCEQLTIVTQTSEETVTHQGKKIRIVPAWKWALLG